MATPIFASNPLKAVRNPPAIERYYQLHARIYDATRWSFLFGRTAIVEQLAGVRPDAQRVLEIGCGTGRNLVQLAERFPAAAITGVDLSDSMLAIARRKCECFGPRVTLRRQAYGSSPVNPGGYDVILASYALSMFNPGFAEAIAAARAELAPGGCFGLVDFHATRFRWFARWMGVNHVRMEAHLQPLLAREFYPGTQRVRSAYGGVWQYLLFVGRAS